MSIESAAADAAAALDDYDRADERFARLSDRQGVVRDEIEALKVELAFWDRLASDAWARLMISDDRLMAVRGRLRVELDRRKAVQLTPTAQP